MILDTADKTLWQLVIERAAATPDKRMAFDEAGRTMTFAGYRDACERAAAGLAARGVGEGTVVSWILPSRFESLVLAGALALLGAVQNPILPIYREREVSFIARQSRCTLLIVPGTFRGFDYPPMAAAATEGLAVERLVADPDLPDGDPATLRAPIDRFRMSGAGCSTPPERQPTRRAPSTPIARCLRPTTGCSGACR